MSVWETWQVELRQGKRCTSSHSHVVQRCFDGDHSKKIIRKQVCSKQGEQDE